MCEFRDCPCNRIDGLNLVFSDATVRRLALGVEAVALPEAGGSSFDDQKPDLDGSAPLCQYRAMLGETRNQFSLTRAALT